MTSNVYMDFGDVKNLFISLVEIGFLFGRHCHHHSKFCAFNQRLLLLLLFFILGSCPLSLSFSWLEDN